MRTILFTYLLLHSVTFSACCANDTDYLPPTNYYTGATGTGAILKSQLATAMSTGHIQRRYGDFRYSAAITDADPNQSGNILLAYNRASVSGTWNSGNTWNREHVWPQSLQPGNASNSTKGNLGDPHALRPANPSINSSRGNKPFGLSNSTGNYGAVSGGYYFPGDTDKGDIARQLFYSDTRWASQGISLVNGTPGSNQMGDLSSLLEWHYLDTPDEFERRRNQAIYSSGLNPSYYTSNRNAYIDHPEYAWSIYVDQKNDSQLYVGNSPTTNGDSSLTLDMGTVFTGSSVPTVQSIDIYKNGFDGSYFDVSTSGFATSSLQGGYNSFAINNTGSDSLSFNVGINNSATLSAGMSTGQVLIDNLDITTQGGTGRGANDGNDVIDISLSVVDRSEGSFSATSNLDTLTVDLGTIAQGSADIVSQVQIYNLESTAGFTSAMDLFATSMSGDISELTIDLSLGNEVNDIQAGEHGTINATLSPNTPGSFSAIYEFSPFDDQDIEGFSAGTPLTLQLIGEVLAVPEPKSIVLIAFGMLLVVNLLGRPVARMQRA